MPPPSWIGYELGGRYKIEALLGQGGMSAVYRAVDPNLRRTVAIKLIHNHLSSDPGFIRRFEGEAANVAQLSHPNIVQVYDFNHDDDTYYMVLEYLDGETLQDELREHDARGTRMPIERAQEIMREVASAVGFAHERGMIHRDIKPANVMLRSDGRVMLMDFGIAKMLGHTGMTGTGNVIGTAQYMAPEMVQGGDASPASDIYAMGIMLYEMLSGDTPFNSDSAITTMMKHINDPVPDIREAVPDAHPDLVTVIQAALSKDPHTRYQSVEAFNAAVAAIGQGGTMPLQAPPPPTDYARTRREPQVMPPPPSGAGPAQQSIPPVRSAPAAPAEPARSKLNPILPIALGGGVLAVIGVVLLGGFLLLGPGFGAAANPGETPTEESVADATDPAATEEGAAEPTTEPATAEPTAEPTTDPAAATAQAADAATAYAQQTQAAAPTATPFPDVFVNITNVYFSDPYWVAEYEVYGVDPHDGTQGVPHVHFYWNNIDQTQAGLPGGGPWQLYFGPSPVTLSGLPAQPVDATALCALVATAAHEYILDTGMCYEVPMEEESESEDD